MPPGLFDSIANQGSLFSGPQQGYTPDLNIMGMPGMGGPQGMLLQMLIGPLLQNMMGPGAIPFQFAPTQNFYDGLRSRQMFMAQQEAMRAGAAADQTRQIQMVRGLADMAHIQWTPERAEAARTAAQFAAPFVPLVASMFPEMVDQFHGVRGSAAVGASQFFLGARYAQDPVTGQQMMSGESAGAVNRMLYERLYGPGVDISGMRGMGAGQAGSLYRELQTRGFGPPGLGDQERRALGGGFDAAGGIAAALGGATPAAGTGLRSLEADRVKKRLEEMTGAVTAMKDIFGDLGQPNAPMPMLINALQALTQGGLATMNPAELERTVRNLANTARLTGVGMENMTMLLAGAARTTDALGLNRQLALPAAMGGAAFGRAYGNMTGGVPFFGKMDAERAAILDTQLEANAAASEAANQLAATVRIGKDVGGFKGGTEAAALSAAIEAGETTYKFGGENRSVFAAQARWSDIIQAGAGDRITGAGISIYLGATADNQRTIAERNLGGLTRQLQPGDIRNEISKSYTTAYTTSADKSITANAAKLGEITAQVLLSMDPAKQHDETAVAELVIAAAAKQGISVRTRDLEMGLNQGYSIMAQTMRNQPGQYGGYGAPINLYSEQNERVIAEKVRIQAQAQAESTLQTAMAGLGRGTPLARVFDLMAAGDMSYAAAARQILGGVPAVDVKAVLDDLKIAYDQYGKARTPAEREALAAKIKDLTTKAGGIASKSTAFDMGGAAHSAQAQTPAQVVQSLLTALGATGKVDDTQGRLANMIQGERGDQIRDAVSALEDLSKAAAQRGGTLADYLKPGMEEADLTTYEADLLKRAAPLIGKQSMEEIATALEKYGPTASTPGQQGGGVIAPGTPITINVQAKDVTVMATGNTTTNPKPASPGS